MAATVPPPAPTQPPHPPPPIQTVPSWWTLAHQNTFSSSLFAFKNTSAANLAVATEQAFLDRTANEYKGAHGPGGLNNPTFAAFIVRELALQKTAIAQCRETPTGKNPTYWMDEDLRERLFYKLAVLMDGRGHHWGGVGGGDEDDEESRKAKAEAAKELFKEGKKGTQFRGGLKADQYDTWFRARLSRINGVYREVRTHLFQSPPAQPPPLPPPPPPPPQPPVNTGSEGADGAAGMNGAIDPPDPSLSEPSSPDVPDTTGAGQLDLSGLVALKPRKHRQEIVVPRKWARNPRWHVEIEIDPNVKASVTVKRGSETMAFVAAKNDMLGVEGGSDEEESSSDDDDGDGGQPPRKKAKTVSHVTLKARE